MNGQSLKWWWNLFKEQGENLRLRYMDWDHKIRFFQPTSLELERDGQYVEGTLDNGEVIRFPVESSFWVQYHEGMEEQAKAV